jgi:peptidylprolyl isomerase
MIKEERSVMIIKRMLLVTIVLLGALLVAGCSATVSAAQAKKGDNVQVHYTGKLADGTVFDSSVGKDPIQFTVGAGQMIPGFDKAVEGMKAGEKKTITIPSAEAYGPRHEDLVIEVSLDQLPKDIAVGRQLQSAQPDGAVIYATVTKISDTNVTLDTNHPLAGKDLTFEIELVKIL